MNSEPEIISSVEAGDVDRVASILGANQDAHTELDSMGFSALHLAVSAGDLEMVHLLLNAGANPAAENKFGITALHLAQDPQIVDALVAKGANIEHETKDGRTPLRVAASEADGYDAMKRLLELGANPNARDKSGLSSADIAMDRGESRKVLLLKHFGVVV